MSEKKTVLILCTGNSARSQMAEGILRDMNGTDYHVESAGLEPSHVRPEAIEVMKEIGIDISNHRSKSLEEFTGRHFDHVITVCDNANERCPLFPAGTERTHWSFSDPAAVSGSYEVRREAFRKVRDQILDRFREKFGTP